MFWLHKNIFIIYNSIKNHQQLHPNEHPILFITRKYLWGLLIFCTLSKAKWSNSYRFVYGKMSITHTMLITYLYTFLFCHYINHDEWCPNRGNFSHNVQYSWYLLRKIVSYYECLPISPWGDMAIKVEVMPILLNTGMCAVLSYAVYKKTSSTTGN